jgi:arabinogalactan oligomer / maltooligosaccharide transport system permease protein
MSVAQIPAEGAPAPETRWSALRKRLKDSAKAWVYILPAAVVILIVTGFPYVFQLYMSVTDYRVRNLRFSLLDPATWAKYAPDFVGLDNFVRILTNNLALENYDFWRLLLFNVVWTVANIAIHVVLGIAIAMVLNRPKVIGRRIYRALFVLPWAIPGYVAALTWRNMYDDRFGAINQLLGVANRLIGTSFPTDTRWFAVTDPPIGGLLAFLPLAFYAVLLANVWLGWPFMSVVATGALQAIPSEMYEAASIDGATGWQKIWKITLPLIRPAMIPAIMLSTIWTFNQFSVIFFISAGDPFGRTEILITQAYKLVAEQRLYGVAAAFSIVVFFILLVFTLINNRVSRATEAYDV